jgi:hypothetical protein
VSSSAFDPDTDVGRSWTEIGSKRLPLTDGLTASAALSTAGLILREESFRISASAGEAFFYDLRRNDHSVMAVTGSCSRRVNYLTCKFLIKSAVPPNGMMKSRHFNG